MVAVYLTYTGYQLPLVQKVSCIHTDLLQNMSASSVWTPEDVAKCVEVHDTARSASCPKYPLGMESQEAMDAFYKELNIHIPSTNKSNNPPSSVKPTHNLSS